MTSSIGRFTMRTLNANNGAAANGTTSALSIVSCNSGMYALVGESGSFSQRSEKAIDLTPDFGSTGKSAPVCADKTNQLVAFVDGNKVVLGRMRLPAVPGPVHEQGAYVRLHFAQDRIRFDDVGPRVERQQRLGGTRGTRIQCDYLSVRCTVEEKRHVDGNHQSIPLGVCHPKVLQKHHAARHALVLCAALAF